MKYNVGDIIPFEQIQEATDYVNSIDGNYYLEDYQEDKQGRMMLIVRQLPAPSLDEIKQAKLVELKSMRDSLEVEPIEYNGNYFDYDDKARDRINAGIIALDLAGEGASLSWTTANNTEAVVTANDLRAVIANVAIRSNELHVKYRILKEMVNNAQTEEELEAIQWA